MPKGRVLREGVCVLLYPPGTEMPATRYFRKKKRKRKSLICFLNIN